MHVNINQEVKICSRYGIKLYSRYFAVCYGLLSQYVLAMFTDSVG